jgi:hypothetical protein
VRGNNEVEAQPRRLNFSFQFSLFFDADDVAKNPEIKFSAIPANPGSGPGQAPESSVFQ